ncbi:hypothetical protein EGI26_01790 [Lacihabitans sp. CCS-44]|uniref:hypothetical protein n=1 Tax=Lacihabitans sp. CCS-44 TaxID=2487331 RepID=UPI0020CC36F3|nr:hypothetical protein [Lacihabitans sp. CCS-44]MCP9753892.1 hypothetical protein [Lacihabitans sp. CCS-44]
MTKFIFDRKKLQDLLNDSSNTGDFVVVNLSFDCDGDGDYTFPARVTASISDGQLDELGTIKTGEKEEPGCPSPPGCTTKSIRNKLNMV